MDFDEEFEKEGIEIDVIDLILALLRRSITIICFALFCGALMFAYADLRIPPEFSSTTQIYIMDKADGSTKYQLDISDFQSSTYLTKDYMALIKSEPVMDQVISDLNLDMKADELAEKISVENVSDTRILKITAKANKPILAKEIADTVCQVSKSQIRNIMGVESVNIVEEGNVASKPASPDTSLYAKVGVVLGAFISIVFFVISFIISDPISSSKEIERKLGISVLGVIPLEGRKKKQQNPVIKKIMDIKRRWE